MGALWKEKESPQGHKNVNNKCHLKCPLGLTHLHKEELGQTRSSWNNPLGICELKVMAFDVTALGSNSQYLWISVPRSLHYFAGC